MMKLTIIFLITLLSLNSYAYDCKKVDLDRKSYNLEMDGEKLAKIRFERTNLKGKVYKMKVTQIQDEIMKNYDVAQVYQDKEDCVLRMIMSKYMRSDEMEIMKKDKDGNILLSDDFDGEESARLVLL